MQILLNGQQVQIKSRTLRELVVEKDIAPEAIVAEVNLQLIKKEHWQQYLLNEGDTVELLSFVGGG